MLCQPKFVLTPASRISTCSVPILPCSWLFRGTFSFMRLLTSSSTNRWKAAEIQLHSSTLARLFTHLKCLVLRDTDYSQELCSLGQDAVDSFMCCPSLSLRLFSPHLPFHPIFPSLEPGFMFLFAQVELASFPAIQRRPSPGLVQWQEATDSAATCPFPGLTGTGSRGWWGVGAGRELWRKGWCFRQEYSWHPVLFYGF